MFREVSEVKEIKWVQKLVLTSFCYIHISTIRSINMYIETRVARHGFINLLTYERIINAKNS